MKAGRYVSVVTGVLLALAVPLNVLGKDDDRDERKGKPEPRFEQRDAKGSLDARLDKIAEQLERLQGDVQKLKARDEQKPAKPGEPKAEAKKTEGEKARPKQPAEVRPEPRKPQMPESSMRERMRERFEELRDRWAGRSGSSGWPRMGPGREDGDRPGMGWHADAMYNQLQERLEKAHKEAREQSPRESAERLREILRDELRRLERFSEEDGPRHRAPMEGRRPGPRGGRGR